MAPSLRVALIAVLPVLVAAGCLPKPAPVCLRYVACQAAWDAATEAEPKDTSAYAEGGACWGDTASAAQCDLDCTEAVQALTAAAASLHLDLPACS